MIPKVIRDPQALKSNESGVIQDKSNIHNDAEAHNNLGVAYHVRGQIDVAINEYKNAITINPNLADAHSNLGVAYYTRGNVDRAIKEWKEALRISPSLAQPHYNLAVAAKAEGNLDGAATELENALNIEPNDADTTFSLAETYQSQGKPRKALDFYKRFIELASAKDADYVKVAEDRISRLKGET